MTQFEFVGIGISLVLGLCFARLLEGARDTFDPARRYWIHALWLVNKLMNTALLFWGGWVYRDVESWSFVDFLLLIAGPAIVFLQAHALVTAHPADVVDWRAHFWSIRRWFFSANALQITFNFINVYVVGNRAFPSPEIAPLSLIFVLSVVGAVSSRERLHGFIAIVAFLNLTLGFGILFTQAG